MMCLHSTHCTTALGPHHPFQATAPLPAPSSPSLGAGVPTLTTPQGPCPHHEILRASWPLTHSLQLSKCL